MKGKQGDLQRLQHIAEAITDIQQFIGNISYEEYEKDYQLRLATVKLLEIIGEAVNHLSSEITTKHHHEDWAANKGMRNIFVHEYFGIDYEIVWKSIQNRLPQLKESISAIIASEF